MGSVVSFYSGSSIGTRCIRDPWHKLQTLYQTELFKKKQKFMFAVFKKTLKTDTGKTLVRSHINDHDAQKVFKELSTTFNSNKAYIDSSTILSYLTSARLGDGSWKNWTHAFILHWQGQVRKYEALLPVADNFSEGPKKTMLKNAVHKIAEIWAVKQ